jgi:peptidoglycan biosynthesis protein MviN/MurJ (putative lipid II flippase)
MFTLLGKARRQLSDPASEHRRIAIGFFWVSLFVLVGKLAGAAKEMAIAWRYGVGPQVDAYVVVFNLVTWPVSIWLNILTIALVPALVRTTHADPAELSRFRGELMGWNLVLAIVFGLAAWVALPWVFQANWFSLREDIRLEALAAVQLLALVTPLGVMSSYLSTLVMARGGYRNTLLEAVPAAAILVALFAPAGIVPAPLLWGTVAGFALQMGVLAVMARTGDDLSRIRVGFRSPAWQAFGRTVLVMVAGQAIAGLSIIIDQFFAARIGAGAASSLSYASRLMALILGMGAIGISRATLHVFSEVHETSRHTLHGLALRWSAIAFGVGLLAAVACGLAAPVLVKLLFERGAFTQQDTLAVGRLLRISVAQLPFYFSTTVLMNYLASASRHRVIGVAAAFALAAKVAFLLLPIPWPALDVLAASAVVFIAAWFAALLVPALRTGNPGGKKEESRHPKMKDGVQS